MTFEAGSSAYKGSWYIRRNSEGDRDVTIPANTPVYSNTGREMAKSYISIIWMCANDGRGTDWKERFLEKHKMVVSKLSNKNYIIIGLQTLSKEDGEQYELLMKKNFGNKFFNIRE